MSTVLVVAAHPDDEVLGCGGTIAALSRTHDVHVAILGEGATSRAPRRDRAPKRAVARLQQQSREAAKVLKVRSVQLAGLPDNRFDALPLLEIVKQVEAWVVRLRPEAVYTHHPGDLNVDHQLTFRAVLTATRPQPGWRVRELYAFEVPSSTEWAFQRLEPAFRPTVFSEISATIEQKLRALRCYADEVRPFPHPRSVEALRAIAHRWGSVVGMEYAEAFELIRLVR